ncbi:hypothetical protein GYMLUDRAFT_57354 [Collybiopsis luxurians FD-317 M1]|uniref:Uncharacterized protein n=1 Tax=Collybiopsis luxurians FD-317 M1 TaxID=944289 RepID=A0A0D0BI28_9AGAR|nr:hypothetical protein GYMLUDRAFT_57354 [Collybiopsis luxurians FD-317 M1]
MWCSNDIVPNFMQGGGEQINEKEEQLEMSGHSADVVGVGFPNIQIDSNECLFEVLLNNEETVYKLNAHIPFYRRNLNLKLRAKSLTVLSICEIVISAAVAVSRLVLNRNPGIIVKKRKLMSALVLPVAPKDLHGINGTYHIPVISICFHESVCYSTEAHNNVSGFPVSTYSSLAGAMGDSVSVANTKRNELAEAYPVLREPTYPTYPGQINCNTPLPIDELGRTLLPYGLTSIAQEDVPAFFGMGYQNLQMDLHRQCLDPIRFSANLLAVENNPSPDIARMSINTKDLCTTGWKTADGAVESGVIPYFEANMCTEEAGNTPYNGNPKKKQTGRPRETLTIRKSTELSKYERKRYYLAFLEDYVHRLRLQSSSLGLSPVPVQCSDFAKLSKRSLEVTLKNEWTLLTFGLHELTELDNDIALEEEKVKKVESSIRTGIVDDLRDSVSSSSGNSGTLEIATRLIQDSLVMYCMCWLPVDILCCEYCVGKVQLALLETMTRIAFYILNYVVRQCPRG